MPSIERDQHSANNVSSSIAKGAAWMILLKLSERSIGFVSTLVLARLLTPGDFGLVAMAMSMVALTELMSAFNFDITLIQRQNVSVDQYNTAWTYNIMFSTAIGLILLLLTWPASGFYHEPRLIQLMPVLALSSLIQGFENVGVIAFRKEMNFRQEFRFLFSKKIVSFTVTMILAFIYHNYWALVLGTLAGKSFGVLASYYVQPYRPRLCLAASKDLFHFSKWLLINNLTLFLQTRSADFILGRTVGPYGLGIYGISLEISTLPSTELVAPINRAALPGYARVSHDKQLLKREFLRVISMLAMFVVPIGIGLATVADPAVRLLLGKNWLETIPLIQILAVYGTINALQSNIAQVLLALGIPKVITAIGLASVVLILPSLYYVSSHFGAIGAAYVLITCALLISPAVHAIFFHITGISINEYLAAVWKPLVSTAVMAATVLSFRHGLTIFYNATPASIELISSMLIGSITYCVILLSLWALTGKAAGPEQSILDNILPRIAFFDPSVRNKIK